MATDSPDYIDGSDEQRAWVALAAAYRAELERRLEEAQTLDADGFDELGESLWVGIQVDELARTFDARVRGANESE